MAGLAGAIIVIRGMDLFSKPMQSAARSAQTLITRLELQGNTAQAAMVRSAASVDLLQGKLATLAGAFSSSGLMMTATLTAPLAMAAVAISKTSIDFEESMRNIQSISRGTDEQTKELGQTFISLSRDISKTVATPKELAEAFYEIQSSGFFGADAMKILEVSTQAATAGMADQKDTALATVMALNAYGKGAEEAGHYTDVMLRGVDIGIFHLEDLTDQMGDFIAMAGMLGIPIEEVVAALTTMTKKGLPIDESATSLNRIFTAYLKSSDKAKEAASGMGIELSANRIKAIGFAAAMNEVMVKTGGSADKIAEVFPEMRSLRGFINLASDGMVMFKSDTENMYNAFGTRQRVFNTQIQAWSNQIQNFKNNVTALALSFGNVLLPMVTRFLREHVTPLIAKLINLNDATKETIIRFAALAAAMGPVGIVFGQLLNTTAMLLGVVKPIANLLLPLGAVFGNISGPIAAVALGIIALTAALGGLAAAYVVWDNNTLGFGDKLTELAGADGPLGNFTNALLRVFQVIKDSNLLDFGAELDAVKSSMAGFGTELAIMFEAIGMKLPTQRELIEAVVKAVALLIIDIITLGKQLILAAAIGINTFTSLLEPIFRIASAIADVISLLGILIQEFVALAKGDLSKALDFDAKGLAKIEAIKDNIAGIPDAIKDAGKTLKDMPAIYNPMFEQIATDAEAAKERIRRATFFTASNDPNGPDALLQRSNKAKLALGWQNPFSITGNERDTSERSVRGGVIPETATKVDGLANSVGGLGSKSDDTKTALDSMITSLKGFLAEGIKFANSLWDFEGSPGGKGGNPLAPGANGPYEDIYRIMDIAASKYRGKGADTDKWMQMYGLDPDQAEIISDKFRKGLVMDPSVMPYINFEALGNMALLEEEAKKQQQALAEKLAADTGLGKKVFLSMFGISEDEEGGTIAPDINVGAIREGIKAQTDALPKDAAIAQSLIGVDKETAKTAANSTLGILLPAFDTSITDNADAIGERGAAYWGKFENGLIDAAKSSGALYSAVNAMVLAALAAP